MTLGINTTINDGSSFLPQIRYNVDGGRLFQVDRTQDVSGQWETQMTELKEGFSAVFDFGSIETGWMLIIAGMAPSWLMVPLGAKQPDRPSEEHRHGFRMKIWNPNTGVREFAASSKTLVDAVDEIHTLFERAPESRAGLVPVVRYLGTTMIPARGGQSKARYRPNFEIVRWVERAREFGDRTVPIPAPKAEEAAKAQVQQNIPQPGSAALNPRHVGPPQPKPAVPRDVDEWGSAAAMPAAATAQRGSIRDELNDEIPF